MTTLSTIAMVAYPVIFAALGLDDRQSGFLIGATVHDVAQVVGAGYSISTEAGDLATIVKLFRVAILPIVLVLILLSLAGTGSGDRKVRLPLFVIGFVVLASVAGGSLATLHMYSTGVLIASGSPLRTLKTMTNPHQVPGCMQYFSSVSPLGQ